MDLRSRRRRRPASVLAACCSLMLLQACEKPDPRVDWRDLSSVPIAMRENLEIGVERDWRRQTASLSLVCGPAGDVHLLLRMRLPEPRDYKPPWTNHMVIIVGNNFKQELPVDLETVALGPADTNLSPTLTDGQVDLLARLVGSPPSQEIYIGSIMEMNAILRGTANAAAIRQFTSRCARQNAAPIELSPHETSKRAP